MSQIATFNILKARSAVRDVGRVMGMPFGDVDRIAKLIPEDLNITVRAGASTSRRSSRSWWTATTTSASSSRPRAASRAWRGTAASTPPGS